jgi:hypothetical protein
MCRRQGVAQLIVSAMEVVAVVAPLVPVMVTV